MGRNDDYQWLFRKAPAMATAIDEDGCYLDVNDAFERRLGYTREEMIGRRPLEFVTAETARRIEEEFRPALRRTGKLESKLVSFVARTGEVVDCLTDAIIEYDPEGRFLHTIAMYAEVTDQARAAFKYRDLYRSTPAMLHTLDADGHIQTVTDHWLQKLGYTREEVLGRPVTDFYSESDRRRFSGTRLAEAINRGEFTNVDRQMVTKDGRVLDIVMSSISHVERRYRTQASGTAAAANACGKRPAA
jgi:PAS domain S-box-containing protein